MAVKDTLAARLIAQAQLSQKEAATALVPDFLDSAIIEHSPSNTSFEALPSIEYELVLLLAWERVCYSRASNWASQPSASGASVNGFGSDRDTPYTKSIKLAKELRDRYIELKAAVALAGTDDQSAAGDITVGDFFREEDTFNARVPLRVSPTMRAPLLYNRSFAGGEVVLAWDKIDSPIFTELYIFKCASTGIRQEWNVDGSSGIPFVRSDAVSIYRTTDNIARGIKITGVVTTTTYVLVALDTVGFPTFSNEVTVTVP